MLFNKDNNKKAINGYDKEWTNESDGTTYKVVNCNNNGTGGGQTGNPEWNYIRIGSKNSPSVGSITTASPFVEAIAESAITIDKVTKASINSIKLLVSTSKDFTTDTTTSYDVNVAKGEQTTKIKTPVANAYYRYVIDCKKASNGSIQISKITFTTVAE